MKKAYKSSISHSIFQGPKKHIRTGPDNNIKKNIKNCFSTLHYNNFCI